ncbi:hypothetical protein RclHR1_00330017 [Rhizophagus clarus]|uniref:Kinase-like domain-containing protein n=1 Tax=Rhizophagus clarus TaxID=94130 RepID=A0A2Z6R9E7_9GLOM|nr:hypothetical protein RclHR1_00330017 [Rhizophagus clarus]GES81737.1 kinase-like domain-containing protein [Rhizophagus clarus]
MELTNDDCSFDPTPKLKSSPIPVLFISFNQNDTKCIYCGEEFIESLLCGQKYCKKCLSCYITEINDHNRYLDIYLYTKDLECNKHEISKTIEPQNIQECCRNCFEILCFKQIPVITYLNYIKETVPYYYLHKNVIESEEYCKLCGKSHHNSGRRFKLCSDCYLISSGCTKSTLTEKPVQIIYLPWWHNTTYCDACKITLTFTSECQKYCGNCLIFYIGCRYCLTTNVIFGPTIQSQCKKCKRTTPIIFDIAKISIGNKDLDVFLSELRLDIHNNLKITEFISKIKDTIDNYFLPYSICDSIYQDVRIQMEWIPFSQFTNVKEITKGGFSIIYQAIWSDGPFYIIDDTVTSRGIRYYRFRRGGIIRGGKYRRDNETVILKRFINSQDIDKYFLNELKSNQYCYQIKHHIVKTFGFTKDPKLDDYILVMEYARGGDLHNYLQKNFTRITWDKKKLSILWQISEGLETIHKAEFIHRDFHSGNILSNLISDKDYNPRYDKRNQWQIGDLGLSQPVNKPSSNNEIYGVIPYIAPEIFKGSSFSKETDIYCMGMIMWELTTGCKPFANVEHDINLVYKVLDGERPEITEDTPECYANLMKRCWDSDPKKRPTITEIRKTFGKWFFKNKHIEPFNQAEIKRKELMNLKKLGPEFCGKPHPNAIFTSRSLSPFISKCSSINSSRPSINFSKVHSIDYTSIELDLDIDIERPYIHGIKRNIIEELDVNFHENNGKHIKLL